MLPLLYRIPPIRAIEDGGGREGGRLGFRKLARPGRAAFGRGSGAGVAIFGEANGRGRIGDMPFIPAFGRHAVCHFAVHKNNGGILAPGTPKISFDAGFCPGDAAVVEDEAVRAFPRCAGRGDVAAGGAVDAAVFKPRRRAAKDEIARARDGAVFKILASAIEKNRVRKTHEAASAKHGSVAVNANRERMAFAVIFDLFKNLGMNFGQVLGFEGSKLGILAHKLGVDGKLVTGTERKIDSVFEYLLAILKVPELAPRIAEMKSLAEKNGWDITQGLAPMQIAELIRAGKEVNIDYTRAGEWARVWNRYVPFVNAGIQGMKSSYDAFLRNPAGWLLHRGLAVSLLAAANWFRNKDEDWWKELNAGDRRAYDFLRVGGEVLRIPRLFQVDTIFKGFVVEMLDAAYNEQPDRVTDWLKGAVEQFSMTVSPGNGIGPHGVGVNPNAIPPLLREGIAQAANYDTYWKSPIVSRTQQQLAPRDQFGPYTSRVAVELGDIFHLSPRRIDHFVRGLFAGVGGDLMALAGRGPEADGTGIPLIGAAFKTADWEPYDTPIFGRAFFRRGGTEDTGERSINALYEAFGKAVETRDRQTPARKAGGAGEFHALADAIRAVQALGEAHLIAGTREQRNALSALRSQIARDALQALREGGASLQRHAGAWRDAATRYKPSRFNYNRETLSAGVGN